MIDAPAGEALAAVRAEHEEQLAEAQNQLQRVQRSTSAEIERAKAQAEEASADEEGDNNDNGGGGGGGSGGGGEEEGVEQAGVGPPGLMSRPGSASAVAARGKSARTASKSGRDGDVDVSDICIAS